MAKICITMAFICFNLLVLPKVSNSRYLLVELGGSPNMGPGMELATEGPEMSEPEEEPTDDLKPETLAAGGGYRSKPGQLSAYDFAIDCCKSKGVSPHCFGDCVPLGAAPIRTKSKREKIGIRCSEDRDIKNACKKAASGMLNTVARTQASTSIPRYVAASLSNLVTLAPISGDIPGPCVTQEGCENGGSCAEEKDFEYMREKGMDIGMCLCPPGYSGDRCQIKASTPRTREDVNVLNDPGEQCCKDDGVPSKCLGMCNRHFNDDKKDHVMKDECKKVWNEIKNCQDLTKENCAPCTYLKGKDWRGSGRWAEWTTLVYDESCSCDAGYRLREFKPKFKDESPAPFFCCPETGDDSCLTGLPDDWISKVATRQSDRCQSLS